MLISHSSYVLQDQFNPIPSSQNTVECSGSGLFHQGPRCLWKHGRHPCCWSGGIIPPPFDVSIASNMATTSSISGRLSGFASQHLFITCARELGQQRGISGLKFCSFQSSHDNVLQQGH